MPSYLGRYFSLSFRTERLIMNLLGLVNSTLDWSTKWSNKLEQIWNLSLSQGTLLFDTLGEDTIKTVLSWVVITRIIIAHLYTFFYMTNIYPILTSSRPNLLLPWLILSFFKNVVLEIIVIAIGLLLWYDKRFSLSLFLEFAFVKVLALALSSYNWYSNSCLYLELRSMQRPPKLKRSLRSDSNLIASRLYLKIADSKYRTRSLTTLISCDSYETYDTHDTISRIIDDPHLTPAQKAMRILGVTEQDITEARTRIKEREIHRRLTEEEDELFSNGTRDIPPYFFVSGYRVKEKKSESRHTKEEVVMDETKIDDIKMDEAAKDEIIKDEAVEYEIVKDETVEYEIVKHEAVEYEIVKDEAVEFETVKVEAVEYETVKVEAVEYEIITDEVISDEITNDSSISNNLERTKDDLSEEINVSMEQHSLTKKRGTTDSSETKETKRIELCSTCHMEDSKECGSLSIKRDPNRLCCSRFARQSMENGSRPVKLQELFNCNCIVDEELYKENMQEYCFAIATIKTSTPNGTPDKEKIASIVENDSEDSRGTIYQSCTQGRNDSNETEDFMMEKSFPLKKKLSKNNINILQNIQTDDQRLETNLIVENRSMKVEEVSGIESSNSSKYYDGECSALVDLEDQSEVAKDSSETKNPITNSNISKIVESEDSKTKLKNAKDILKTIISMTVTKDNVSSMQNDNSNPCKQITNKTNMPEYSFGDTSIPSFLQNSIKVFDGFYQKDFKNNPEVQCLLQQLEKRGVFPGLTQGMSTPSTFLKQNDQENRLFSDPSPSDFEKLKNIEKLEKIEKVEKIEKIEKIERNEVSISSTLMANHEHPVSQIVQMNNQSFDHVSYTSNDIRVSSSSKLRNSMLKEPVKLSLTRQKLNKSNGNQKKPPSFTKSVSDKSSCECKEQQTESKHSTSLELKIDKKEEERKCTSKCKVETFGTIPLSQVVRPSMFDSFAYRRKPPVYPKKMKSEVPPQSSVSSTNSKKMSTFKKLPESIKRSTDKQSTHASKRFKWKNRTDSIEEQRAREIRALRAYNEDTLVKYKIESEIKKRVPPMRNSVDLGTKSSRNRSYSKEGNLDRSKKNVPKNTESTYDDYLNKENLFVDVTTETEPLLSLPVKDSKEFVADGKLSTVPNEKYSCSKLSKVNKVTDKLLDNFDRLHGAQAKQDTKKMKLAGETDTRKQYTKYSKPKKLTEEENVSIVSIKKLEGTQKGRELERTPAKEDVTSSTKDQSVPPKSLKESTSDTESSVNNDHDKLPSSPVNQVGHLVTTIKSTVTENVAPSHSSSTADQGDEQLLPVQDNSNIVEQVQATPEVKPSDHKKKDKTTLEVEDNKQKTVLVREMENHREEIQVIPEIEDGKTDEIEESKDSNDVLLISSTESIEHEELARNETETEETVRDNLETPQNESEATPRIPISNSLDFTRNVNASPSVVINNLVILNNSSVPAGNNLWDIVDDDTVRVLHNAFSYQSYRSVDITFVLSSEILTIDDTLNNRNLKSPSDDFIYELDREPMTLPIEELPPLADEDNNFEQSFLAMVRQLESLQEEGHGEELCNLFISIIDHERSLNGFVILRNSNALFRILDDLQNPLNDENETEQIDEEEEEEEEFEDTEERSIEDERMLRFIKEDIFTDIKFPIIVRWTDFIDDTAVSNVDLDELDVTFKQTELSKINLFSLLDDEYVHENRIEEVIIKEITQDECDKSVTKTKHLKSLLKIRRPVFATAGSSRQIVSVSEYEIAEGIVHEETIPSYLEKLSAREMIEEIITIEDVEIAEEAEESSYFGTYKEIEEIYKCKETKDAMHQVIDQYFGLRETEKIDKNIRLIEIKGEENKKGQVSVNDKTLEIEEYDFLDETNEIQETRMSDFEVGKEKIMELKEEISLRIIFTFWLVVFLFYVQYFYRKIFSFKQISTATSTLKPFEIHTVPTSTTTLLENSNLVRIIKEENEKEGDEENDSLERIVDFEIERISRSNNDYSLSSDSIPGTSSTNLKDEREDSFKEDKDKLEETIWYLCKQTSRNIEILPFVVSNENDLSNIGLQEGESEIDSESIRSNPRIRLRSLSPFKSPITTNSESEKTDVSGRPSVIKRELSEFHLAEEEIETLRYKIDDDSSSTSSLPIRDDETKLFHNLQFGSHFVKVETDEEEVPNVENVQNGDDRKESTSSGFEIREEHYERSNEEEKSAIEQTTDSEKIVSPKQNDEVREQNESLSSLPTSETNLQMMDSFDSTYTRISDVSRGTDCLDINESSMEEFVDASNESNDGS